MRKPPSSFLKNVKWKPAESKVATFGVVAACHISSGHTKERNGLEYKYRVPNVHIRLMSSKSNNNTSSSSNFTRKVAKTGIRASAISLHSRSSSTSSLAKSSGSAMKANASLLPSSPPSHLSPIRNSQDENVSSKKSRIGPGPIRSSTAVASSAGSGTSHAKHSSMSSAATAYWVANHSHSQSPSRSWDTYKQPSSLSTPNTSNGLTYFHAEADQRERDALFSVSPNNIPDENLSSSSIATVIKRSDTPSVTTENIFSGKYSLETIKARPSSTKKRKAVNMPLPIPFPSVEGSSTGTTVKTSEVTVQASSASNSSSSAKTLSAATTKAIMKDGSTLTAVAQAQTPSPASVPSISAKYIPPLAFDSGEDVFADPFGVSQGRSGNTGFIKHGRNSSLPSNVDASSSKALKGKACDQTRNTPKISRQLESHIPESQRGFTLRIRPFEKHVEFWDFSDNEIFLWHGSLLLTPPPPPPPPTHSSSTIAKMNFLRNSAPEILGLDIRCKSVARQGRHAREDPDRPVFFARYMGEMSEETNKSNSTKAIATTGASMTANSGAAAPTVTQAGSASALNVPDPLSNAPELSVRISSWSINPFDASTKSGSDGSTTSTSRLSSGWVLPFTIPIPTRHFAKMESRQFRLKAVVKVRISSVTGNVRSGDKSKPLSGDELQETEVGEDVTKTEQNGEFMVVSRPIEITVSHLRRGREMSNFHQPMTRRTAEHSRLSDAAVAGGNGKKKITRMKMPAPMEYESGDECSDDEFALT